MKKLKLFSLLMLLFVGVTNLWAKEGDVVYKLNTGTTAIATSNSYAQYGPVSCASDQDGSTVSSASWKITLGSKQTNDPAGLWLGSNSGQKAKMILSNGNFSEASAIATAIGKKTSDTYHAAIIGETALSNVGKVTLSYSGTGGKAIEGAWILYSTDDGKNWTVAKSLTKFTPAGTDFKFDATIESARYAFVMYTSAWGSLKVPVLTFYEGAAIVANPTV